MTLAEALAEYYTVNPGLSGTNKIAPSLSAPGFCNVHGSFAKPLDLTAFAYTTGGSAAIRMIARTSTPEYQGFKFAFGGHGVPKTSIFGGGSFKAGFNVTGTSDAIALGVCVRVLCCWSVRAGWQRVCVRECASARCDMMQWSTRVLDHVIWCIQRAFFSVCMLADVCSFFGSRFSRFD